MLSLGISTEEFTLLLMTEIFDRVALDATLDAAKRFFESVDSLSCGLAGETVKRFYAEHPDLPHPHSTRTTGSCDDPNRCGDVFTQLLIC